MKNSNSFALKSFFEQWLPRLIALGVFAYLIYSLLFRQDEFSWLHIAALAIVIALILAPMASRLRVLNFIDFSSKLNDVMQEQQETKSQLSEIRNQMSTFVSTRVNPIQIMTTNGSEVFRELFSSFRKTESGVDSTVSIEKGIEYTKEKFLRHAYGYRYRAYTLLLMTMYFQLAMREHREFEQGDFVVGDTMDAMREHREFEQGDFVVGDTMDETIPDMIKRVLDNGLDTVFPIRVIDEKSGETRSVITPEIVEGLKQINSLLDLYQKIENDETELPSRLDIDSLFDKIADALNTISLSLKLVGTNSILYQYRMLNTIETLKREIEQADAEQRPIRFPPPNSD